MFNPILRKNLKNEIQFILDSIEKVLSDEHRYKVNCEIAMIQYCKLLLGYFTTSKLIR